MNRTIALVLLSCLSYVLYGQISKTVDVTAAGSLHTFITSTEKSSITNLKLTGTINYTDIRFLANMPVLSILDISKATIKAYNETSGSYLSFPANELPNNSFDNSIAKPSTIFLPENLLTIGVGCFSQNKNIKSITIPALVQTIRAFAFNHCSNLTNVIFMSKTPPAVGSFTSRIVFSRDGTVNNVPEIYVPRGCVNAFKNTTDIDIWKRFNIYENRLRLSTQDANGITNSSARLYGTLEFISTTPVNSSGFCWNTAGSPTTSDSILDKGAAGSTGTFVGTITTLQPATRYYVRTFATDETETVYGNEISFTTTYVPDAAGSITGPATICQGEKSITYTVPLIHNATSYRWTLPDGSTGSSTSNSIKVDFSTNAESGTLSVRGINESGEGRSSSIYITVNNLPKISFTNKTTNCNKPVKLSPIISYNGNGTLSYQWTPATGLDNDKIANPTTTVTRDITYELTVSTSQGCTASAEVKVAIVAMDKPTIGIVGVNNANKNIVVWNKPASEGIDSFLIYRETTISDIYKKTGAVPYSELSVFVDTTSNPTVKSNKYKLSIVDKSGLESQLSDPHKTMHLSINRGQNNSWNLIWEPYSGFTPSTYNIYRGNTPTSLNFLDATSGSSTQYADITAPSGDVYYQLEVISPTLVNPSKIKASEQVVALSYNSSRSNIAGSFTSATNDFASTTQFIRIYTNPAQQEIKIECEGGTLIEIQNTMGQVVYSGNLETNNFVSTSGFSPGVYLIKITTGSNIKVSKVQVN